MIYFIIGLIVGIVGTYLIMARKSVATEEKEAIDLPDLYEAKAENIGKLKEHLKGAPKISNEEV